MKITNKVHKLLSNKKPKNQAEFLTPPNIKMKFYEPKVMRELGEMII